MQDFVPTVSQVSRIQYLGKGVNNALDRATALGSRAVAQVEPPYLELARSTRLFAGGLTLVANAIVPVVDLPTTTGPFLIYNTASSGGRSLALVRASVTIGSGTTGAAGFSLFAGVTAGPVATPLTANGTGVKIQATRGTGQSVAFGASAQTIPAGSTFFILGGIMTTAVAVTGCGYSADVGGALVAPPGWGLVLGILGDLGTSAKYLVQAVWAEIECDLDS